MITASQNLNADQLKAVEHQGGPLLVLAGPGTGKTGVLVQRISHLVADRGIRPERILALTFSRRAADEMRARVTSRLPEAEKVEVRTFHSFALSIVRRHAGSLGLRSAPEIVPTGEQWALVSDILGEEDAASWGLPPGAFDRSATVREVYDLMLRAQEYLLGPRRLRDLGEHTGRQYLVRAGAVLERYTDRLRLATMTDYEGVVQYALRLLNPGGRTAAEISGLYDHVLVDEFQDTNGSQMALLRRLIPGERPNVFCVGDDAQSIYGFRGARIENVRDFAKAFPGTREIHLRTNYRSAAHIVSLAEQAIGGDFATSEYALKASSYPLHEGADLPEQGPAQMVEVSFAIEVGGSEVRGRIDAVFLDEDGTVHLIDWKTGRPPRELQESPAAPNLRPGHQSPLERRAREDASRLHLCPRRREGRSRGGGGLSRERRTSGSWGHRDDTLWSL